jgi:SAM-dependent methyltransferase
MERCPLCNNPGDPFYKDEFYLCRECAGIYRSKSCLPSSEKEKERYLAHHNDISDPGYRKFVSPIIDQVLQNYSAIDEGLDFGAGPGPVISTLLTEKGYRISQYDPFFCNKPELLVKKYDYIVCCEVIEHFHNPHKEFELLYRLMKPGGHLYCITGIYSPHIHFGSWHYIRDFTHVFIWQEKTLHWVAENLGFSSVSTDNNLVCFIR